MIFVIFFFFSSRRRHTRCLSDWSSDVCSSDLQISTPIVTLNLGRCWLYAQNQNSKKQGRSGSSRRDIPLPNMEFYLGHRSEERRVGKECRSRWWPYY